MQRSAKKAGMSVSAWVLSCVQTAPRQKLQQLFDELARSPQPSYVLAELNDILSHIHRTELEHLVNEPLRLPPSALMQNQIAAMIELAAHRCGALLPMWVHAIAPLDKPVFASDLLALRLHLLVSAPPPFRRRNLFVDASLGDRV